MLVATTAPRAQQTPNAGTQLQQIPASPSLSTKQPDFGPDAKQAQPSVESSGPKVLVEALTLAGNQTFTTQELVQASGFTAGRYYTLSELRQMAAKVSSYYRERGYFLAQALVPAQEIANGVVQLKVLEGRLGQVELSNASEVSDRTASSLLAGLQDASPVTQAELERRILLLSDLPGVLAALQQSAQRLVPWRQVYRVQLPVKGLRYYSVEAVPTREADGAILWHGFTTDVTEATHSGRKAAA